MNPDSALPQYTQEDHDAARDYMLAQIEQAGIPAELLIDIGKRARKVIENPKEFPAFQRYLKSKGVPEDGIPDEPDYQELASFVAMGQTVQGREPKPAAQPAVAGPISPEQVAAVAAQGRHGDSMLAHITPEEAQMLERAGGTGAINPATGLPEFNWWSDRWKDIKNVAKQLAPLALPIIAIAVPGGAALIEGIGLTLGATGAAATAVGAGVISAGSTLLAGGSVKDALTSGLLTGAGYFLTPILGSSIANAAKGVIDLSPAAASALGSAAFSGGVAALRGQNIKQILGAAATGAAANYVGGILAKSLPNITNPLAKQQPFNDSGFIAGDAEQLAKANIPESQIKTILQASGVNDYPAAQAATLASRGATEAEISAALTNRFGNSDGLYKSGGKGETNSLLAGSPQAQAAFQRYEDSQFLAQDFKNLQALGVKGQQMIDTLKMAGYNDDAINYVMKTGFSQSNMANFTNEISKQTFSTNLFGGEGYKGVTELPSQVTTTTGATTTPITTPAGPAATPPAPVAPPAPALTPAQIEIRAEADFLAADAKQLADQGLSARQISDTLRAAGVNTNAANMAANYAASGVSVKNIADSVSMYGTNIYAGTPQAGTYTPPAAPPPSAAPVTPVAPVAPPAPVVNPLQADADFIAQQVADLQAQRLSSTQIRDILIQEGADPGAVSTALQYRTSSPDIIADKILQFNSGKTDLYTPRPVAPTPTPTPTTPAAVTPTPAAPVTPTPSLTESEITPGFGGTPPPPPVAEPGVITYPTAARPSWMPDNFVEAGADLYKDPSTGTLYNGRGEIINVPDATAAAPGTATDVSRIPIRGVPLQAGDQLPPGVELPPGMRLATFDEINQGLAGRGAQNIGGGQDAWLVPETGTYIEPTEVPGYVAPGTYTEPTAVPGYQYQPTAADTTKPTWMPDSFTSVGPNQWVDPSSNVVYDRTGSIVNVEPQVTPGTPTPTPTVTPPPGPVTPTGGVTDITLPPPSTDTGPIGPTTITPLGPDGTPSGPATTFPAAPVVPVDITTTPPLTGGPTTPVGPPTPPPAVTPPPSPPPYEYIDSSTVVPEPPPVTPPPSPPPVVEPPPFVPPYIPPVTPPPAPPPGTPLPVNVNPIFLEPLAYPGVNPGFVLGAVRPAYQTTQPYQQQYYWGAQPYFKEMADLAKYNVIPGGLPPAEYQPTPYYAQPAAYQVPVYGPNMTIIPPTTGSVR